MNRLLRSLVAMLAVFTPLAAFADYSWNFPEPATPLALDTLNVHNKFMLITIVIFVVVLGIMLYSMVRHRKSVGHQASDFTGPKNRKQLLWTLLPFAILLYIDFILMGIPAAHSIFMMEDTKTNAQMVLKITGSQWKWQYEFMDGDAQGIKFVSNLKTPDDQLYKGAPKGEHYLLEVDNELVLPTNKKIRVLLTATDVIHNWWVPQFGVARDAIPGFLRETWLEIDKPGIYRGQCKELCGRGHGYMPVVVRAVPEEEFKTWVVAKKDEQQATAASADKVWTKDELMAKGGETYNKVCAVCHQPNGQGLPPAFPALAGSKVVNAAVVDGEGHLIKDHHLDRVMNGKAGTAMQAFKNTLSDAEIASVVTYERNSFGNAMGDIIQPSQVKALR
jgi:cytochrome c oxidase subunit 2